MKAWTFFDGKFCDGKNQDIETEQEEGQREYLICI